MLADVRLALTRAAATSVAAAVLLSATAFANPSAPATQTPSAPATETPSAPPAQGPFISPPEPPVVDPALQRELDGKQAELDALQEQIDALDRELAIATEAYNKAAMELAATRERLERTRTDLANAQAALDIQQDTLSERARDIYRAGELKTLDVLLGSKSVSDLVGRLRFLRSMGESDAAIVELLLAQRDQIAATAAALEDEELLARSLEFELKARQIEVVIRLEEREALLAATQSDLLALLEAQAGVRRAAEGRLLRDVLGGANAAGITLEAGSPVETAFGYHGVPYLWGGESPRGFDCSGLLLYIFRQHGVNLPHYSGAQFQLGEKIAPADLQPGDAVFFGSPVYHVGMYVGAGYFIHAPRTGDFVKLSKLAERKDYAGARRYAWSYRTSPIVNPVVDPASVPR